MDRDERTLIGESGRDRERVWSIVLAAADQFVDKLVVLGVVPDGLEVDYGWIVPGEDLGRFGSHAMPPIRSFLEKPERREAMKASALGAVWNTMVMAGRAETFWALTPEHLPEIIPSFERLLDAIDTPQEACVLNAIYEGTPARNFSSALLKRACGNVAVLQLEDVRWSDWGRAERIVQTLRDIGKPAVSGWPPQVADAEPLFDLRCRTRCGLDSWFHALSGDGRFFIGGST